MSVRTIPFVVGVLVLACGGPDATSEPPAAAAQPEEVPAEPAPVEPESIAIGPTWNDAYPLLAELLTGPVVETTEVWGRGRDGGLTRQLQVHIRPENRERALATGRERLRQVEGGEPLEMGTSTSINVAGGTLSIGLVAGTDDQIAVTARGEATPQAMDARCREMRPMELALPFETLPGWPDEASECISLRSISGRAGVRDGGAFTIAAEHDAAAAWLQNAGFEERASTSVSQVYSQLANGLRHSATLRSQSVQVRFMLP